MRVGEGYRRWLPAILAVYILAIAAGFLYFNMRLTVEWVVVILLGAAILSGRGLLFVRDWGVFILVLFAWQLASPLATRFGFPWHLQELIDADKLMFFGAVPPLWLQQHLYHPGVLEPWDVLAASMYMLHFLAPLVAGFLLWLSDRDLFQKFAITFVVVALAGFATYIVYPAVPPWMAAEHLVRVRNTYQIVYNGAGHVYLPGVTNLFNSIAGHWYNPYHGYISLRFLHLQYDQVGAIPSEHAAYPMLFFLFLRRQFGRVAYLALVYIALLLFSITYLGQHYAIDAVVGFAYAIAGYVLVMHLAPAIGRWVRVRRGAGRPVRLAGRGELADLEEA
ncbi:MAG: phosphatase PAP2 family protein [Chloroflexi bacterium]|nr:phosphatase PAP2 family protein [Chloroflexota bacterium]